MNTNANVLLAGFVMMVSCLSTYAAPETAVILPAETQTANLRLAEGAWVDLEPADERANKKYDEQIFTEISPLLDSPDAVKLPDDQLLTD